MSDVHKAEADLIAAEHDFKRKKDLFEQKGRLRRRPRGVRGQLAEDEGRGRESASRKAFLLRAGNVDTVTQTVYAAVAHRR